MKMVRIMAVVVCGKTDMIIISSEKLEIAFLTILYYNKGTKISKVI